MNTIPPTQQPFSEQEAAEDTKAITALISVLRNYMHDAEFPLFSLTNESQQLPELIESSDLESMRQSAKRLSQATEQLAHQHAKIDEILVYINSIFKGRHSYATLTAVSPLQAIVASREKYEERTRNKGWIQFDETQLAEHSSLTTHEETLTAILETLFGFLHDYTLEIDKITIESAEENGTLTLKIANDGIFFSPEDCARLFDFDFTSRNAILISKNEMFRLPQVAFDLRRLRGTIRFSSEVKPDTSVAINHFILVLPIG